MKVQSCGSFYPYGPISAIKTFKSYGTDVSFEASVSNFVVGSETGWGIWMKWSVNGQKKYSIPDLVKCQNSVRVAGSGIPLSHS